MANQIPISPILPQSVFPDQTVLLSANTALDGTGTVQLIGSVAVVGVNGSAIAGNFGRSVPRARVVHRGTNVATVMRFFLNNGSTPTVATNNQLVAEETIASNTISQVAKSIIYDIWLGLIMTPGYRVYYSIGTACAAGHAVSLPDAGDY